MTANHLTSLLALQDQWQAARLDGFAEIYRKLGEVKAAKIVEELVINFGVMESASEPVESFMGTVGKLGTIILWNKLAELTQEGAAACRAY